MKPRTSYKVGDRVVDRETGKCGRIVHVYRTIDLRDDVVVVLFDTDADGLAVPLTSIRRIRRKKGKRS
jgi:hypothetical protein